MAVGGIADHVHLLAGLAATQCVADLVREVKKASSVWASERFSAFAWQAGYAALSVGHSDLGRVTSYILSQEQHHLKLSAADELRSLLMESGVDIDERFFE